MGWLGKALAFLLALVLLGAGAWPLALLIFAFLFVPPLLRARKRRQGSQRSGESGGKFPSRYILGGFLFLLAFFGYLARGTFSPFAFASLGLLVVLWGRIPVTAVGSSLRPVRESILLRSSFPPFSWAAVAEVKPITRELGRALAGVNGTVLFSASETPSIYVVVESTAWSERSAERAVLHHLKEAVSGLSPLGAYLLPLDSEQAVAVLQPSLRASDIGKGDWSTALASGTYDVLSIRQEMGFATFLGTFRRVDQGREGRGRIPTSSQAIARPPFLMEVFKAVGSRLTWPQPDRYAAFLSSLLAASGEPIGTRVLDAGAASQSQMVVRSQGSSSVELTRAQLRAVVRMYDKGTR